MRGVQSVSLCMFNIGRVPAQEHTDTHTVRTFGRTLHYLVWRLLVGLVSNMVSCFAGCVVSSYIVVVLGTH